MDTGLVVVLLLGPVVAALMAGIARAAAMGRIARNSAVGIRLPSTMASDPAWRAGHRAAVVPAVSSLVVLLVLDLVAVLLRGHGPSDEALTLGLVVVLVLAVAWVGVASSRAARATARRL